MHPVKVIVAAVTVPPGPTASGFAGVALSVVIVTVGELQSAVPSLLVASASML